jgi:WD40 repeat protein
VRRKGLFYVIISLLLNTSLLYAEMDYREPAKIISSQTGSSVKCLDVLFTGDFVVAFDSGELAYYRKENFRKISSKKVKNKTIKDISLSRDGKYLLSLSEDNEITLWEIPKLKIVSKSPEGIPPSRYILFHPDGNSIVSLADKGEMLFYSFRNFKLQRKLKGNGYQVEKVAFSDDNLHFVSGYSDGTMNMWSSFLDTPVKSIKAHEGGIIDLTYSPGGKVILSIGRDGVARFWNSKDGTQVEIPDREDKNKKIKAECELQKIGDFLSFSQNKDFLLIGSTSGSVVFVKIPSCDTTDTFYYDASGITVMRLYDGDRYILTGFDDGRIILFRNPLMVAKYNMAMKKGDEAMSQGKYELAMNQYAQAVGIYPEEEAERKLEEARKKKEEKDKERLEEIRKMRERFRK